MVVLPMHNHICHHSDLTPISCVYDVILYTPVCVCVSCTHTHTHTHTHTGEVIGCIEEELLKKSALCSFFYDPASDGLLVDVAGKRHV